MNTTANDPATSPGGSPILRHTQAADREAPRGEDSIEQITAHVQTHLGPVPKVFHEIASDAVHVDVLFVPPTAALPVTRLVTSGMSDLPMHIPDGADVPRHAELMLSLPGDWPLDDKSLEDETWYWPIRLLKFLARLPHKYDTWLGAGHTVPNGDPAAPYAPGTGLAGAIILPSPTVPDAFHTLRLAPDKHIQFYAVLPLYPDEMKLKLRAGTDKLLDKLSRANIGDIVEPGRRNVARKRFGFF